MKKKKMILSVGACLLGIISALAYNTKSKRTSVPDLYYVNSFGICIKISCTLTAVFTTGGLGVPITFRTNIGPVTVYSANIGGTCTNPVSVKLK